MNLNSSRREKQYFFFCFILIFFFTIAVLKSKPNISSETRTDPCELLIIQSVAILVWITSEKNVE